ncbi:3063_t:CDS:1, partial [Paraglomus brasilianum]
MELCSEISRLALTKDEKAALHRYFTRNPIQKAEAVIIFYQPVKMMMQGLSICGAS